MLDFSLYDVASAQEVPFCTSQYVQCIIHRLTSVLLCVPLIFADSEKCQFGSTHDGFLCVMEIVCIFPSGYFDYRGVFRENFDLYCCVMG